MPNEMEEAYKWLESEQRRPEVDYLKHLVKAHQELIERQLDTTEQSRRDRYALRECTKQLAEAQETLETRRAEHNELMRLYRLEKDLSEDYGKKLTRALNILARVKEFCGEMERYGLESSSN